MTGKVTPGKRASASARTRNTAFASASYQTVAIDIDGAIATVTLNRPDVHNAFNAALIAELTTVFRLLGRNDAVRLIILAAAGKSFCAGGDLNWMKTVAGFTRAQNLADAKKLATMLTTLNDVAKPTIARVHGAAYGGGVGLIACCDIAIAVDETVFALSEARLGLIPATISPYVIAAMGARAARRYFLTGERFGVTEALKLGLVHGSCPSAELDTRVREVVKQLLVAGPRAQGEAKALIRAVSNKALDARLVADTARRIARVRATPEGREGVAAFLGKRPPAWLPDE